MGGLAGRQAGAGPRADSLGLLLAACLVSGWMLGLAACASKTEPGGFYYSVQPGDNLYRIGKRFGVPSQTLIRVNDIGDVHGISVGTRLYVPALKPDGTLSARPAAAPRQTQAKARKQTRKPGRLSFAWPVRGRLTSRFGRRDGRLHEGIDMAANRGATIRAAESGKVIHSGRLGAYGKVVIVKHQGDYRSVYAHASKTHVRKGQFVDQGEKIAEVGSTGRASGPHLHFEIRRKESPQDPMLYLP
jgi:murein DD-endopeptidase MepM/ murein hydrolase activator NlpD